MEDLQIISKKLKPLVQSYARDMKILLVDDQKANIEYCKAAFGKHFNVCDIALNGQEALSMWEKDTTYYDLIVSDVDMPVMGGLELLKAIRNISLEQDVIIITAVKDLAENQDLAYYYIDGLIAKPINESKLLVLLYRVLKKIAETKELENYLEILEDQAAESIDLQNNLSFISKKLHSLNDLKEVKDIAAMINTLIKKNTLTIEKQSKIPTVHTNENDLHFSTLDNHMNANELRALLDDSVIDKIENFVDILNEYVQIVDKIESQDTSEAIKSLKSIEKDFDEFIIILDNIGIFPIISRAFINLNTFLNNISEEDIKEQDRKTLLTSLLLNLENDISKWIRNVFLDMTVENIYYFDASFSNTIFEIESIFNTQNLENDIEYDDDDLGFF